ncbi:PIG-L family deacetylase [Streptomyces sp. NPDC002889]|uniref:PIG-L family deacetylase n=1 Tax=Streptomyces sp. NPDC002889 TaxID=3364669 RepID=UPI0036B4E4FB
MRTSGFRRRPALLSHRGTKAAMIAAPLIGIGWLSGAALATSDTQAAPGASGGRHKAVSARTQPKPAPTPRTATTASVMQIVSHPDDDLFFMNPDTRQSISARRNLTSVYLTAGESDGVNAARTGPLAPVTPPLADKARYAEARQNGIRAAYAEMATGDRTSPWERRAIPTAGGGTAELDTLRARPEIRLVWVQLREAGSILGDRPSSLHGLWDGRVDRLGAQLSSGTPVEADFAYTRQQVIDTVAGLLERFRPTHVRMLDPTPGLVEETGQSSDHQDHTFGARFTQAALEQYAASPGHPVFSVQNYLGYRTGGLPATLDAASAEAKLATLRTYAWTDARNYCADPVGCGDRKTAARPAGHGWASSVRYTRGESTSWLQPGRDGGLWAFSVLDNRLAVWHRAAGGQDAWSGPELLAGGGIDSGVTSVRLADGRIAVFATRTTLGRAPGDYRRDVVMAVQGAPDGTFGPWLSLGTPERDDASGLSDISAPAATVDNAGRMTVYLRNGHHSLSSTAQRADGSWTPWKERGGHDLHGDPAVASDAAGRQHVFVATPGSVLSWTQTAPGAPLSGPTATGLPPTTLALSAAAAADGDGVRLWFRKPGSGAARTVHFSGPLASPLSDLGGPAGFGPVSASGPGNGVLALRSGTGVPGTALVAPDRHGQAGRADQAAVRSAQSAQTGPTTWHTAGSPFVGAPAGAQTGRQSTALAALGQEGRLYWAETDGRTPPTAWRPVG